MQQCKDINVQTNFKINMHQCYDLNAQTNFMIFQITKKFNFNTSLYSFLISFLSHDQGGFYIFLLKTIW